MKKSLLLVLGTVSALVVSARTMPIILQNDLIPSEKTDSSSSAPEITKKRTRRGADQRSEFFIISADRGQRLQKTLPSIIHTSREEKPIRTW